MYSFRQEGHINLHPVSIFFWVLVLFASCTIIKKAPGDKPYVGKSSFEVKEGNFTKLEKSAVVQRLDNQLDDSSTTTTTDVLFFIHKVKAPPAYDSVYSGISARNMEASMFHLGYYNAKASFVADTGKSAHTKVMFLGVPVSFKKIGPKVNVKYTMNSGKQTLIDTVRYNLRKPDLQALAMRNIDQGLLKKTQPASKTAVLSEVSRLVDTFRNNGYYKFTAAELRVRGDTTIAALTSASDDPFEQLRLLAEAQLAKDSPKIKLAIVLNTPDDSSKLNQYRVNDIYILQDYQPGDDFNDKTNITERRTGDTSRMTDAQKKRRLINIRRNRSSSAQRAGNDFILRYHKPYIRTSFLARNITLRKDSIFRQDEYYKTLSNLSKAGVWQSVNIQTIDLKDSNKVNLIMELIPVKKFGFEAAIEASYSATSNTNSALGGNLFGVSLNLSLVNRNIGRDAIKMTHLIRTGIELNNNARSKGTQLINSNELSYTNTVLVPRLTWPASKLITKRTQFQESFINTSLAYNNRLKLFNQQSFNSSYGFTWSIKKQRKFQWRPLNAEFNYLFNRTDSFNNIVKQNPFLRYSYTTSFVVGMAGSYSSVYNNPKHVLSLSKERAFKVNIEESGLTWGALPVLKRYKSRYIKLDAEYKYSVNYPKTSLAFRLYSGVGVPLFGDSALPFFKQYYGGGSLGMRGWPVRGIGRGGQKLAGYQATLFNDRTGDMQLEGNIEYRYDIARIIPNSLTLRGALFVDAGNIWNIRNSLPGGGMDSAQFRLKNLYKQLGISAGTGFRLDFNYFVLRIDLGFRFKRPELSYENNGWKLPSLGLDDFLKKMFTKGTNDEYRKWRYENFNLTIGIGLPF